MIRPLTANFRCDVCLQEHIVKVADIRLDMFPDLSYTAECPDCQVLTKKDVSVRVANILLDYGARLEVSI
jgi:hypothetical protein